MGDGRYLRILETKLRPPADTGRLVARNRLLDALAGLSVARLALVSASAGSGKTTLLSQLYHSLDHAGFKVAWLALDGTDNESQRFLMHLIAALQLASPEVGQDAKAALASSPNVLPEEAISLLVNDLLNAGSSWALFLDDYHEIHDKAIHDAMAFLLRYLPANATLVIGCRTEPPLPLGRLRARGGLLEIGWPELRFTLGETREYLRHVQGLHISDNEIRVLNQHTEGWITGLQLAAMSGKDNRYRRGSVSECSGVQVDVADYLLEDVFLRQSPAAQDFLLCTSILDRMTASLCNALTGQRDSQKHLESLDRANLLIFRLDDRRSWYRYHHLFSEFLRSRLLTERPADVATLYRRASEWFERHAALGEAVRYAVRGRLFERATVLLAQFGRDLFRQGAFKELRAWIEGLPEELVRKRTRLCLLHAWALAYLGELAMARRRLSDAESALREECPQAFDAASGVAELDAELQVLRAALGVIQTDEPDVARLRDDVVSQLDPKDGAMRGFAHVVLGYAARARGDLGRALEHYASAADVAEQADSSLVHLLARFNLGTVNYLMGQLHAGEQDLRAGLRLAGERHWLRSMGAGFLRVQLAMILYEQDRLGEALTELSEAIDVLKATQAFGFLGIALVERARTLVALGQSEAMERDLIRARAIAKEHGVSRVAFRANLLEARRAIEARQAEKAEELLTHAAAECDDRTSDEPFPLSEKFENLLIERARLALSGRECGEAVRLARQGLRSAAAAERGRNRVEFLILQAMAWQELGETEKALKKLQQSLALGRGNGFVRLFLDSGPALIALLGHLAESDPDHAEVKRLLSIVEHRRAPAKAKRRTSSRPVDRLHYREEQILKLVSSGLRNREIAARLAISQETVKWYLKRLYGTLDVKSRAQAVTVARELGLLA